MKIRILGLTTLTIVGLVVPAGMSGCTEPQVQCQVGHAASFVTGPEYMMQYEVVMQSPACSDPKKNGTFNAFFTTSGRTGKLFLANNVSFEDYHPATGVNTRDVSQTSVYIETDDVVGYESQIECFETDDPDVGYIGQPFQGTDQPWQSAEFANRYPDANNLCTLASVVPATGAKGTIPAANPAPRCGSPGSSCTGMSCVCVGHCTGLVCHGDTGACTALGDVCGAVAPKGTCGLAGGILTCQGDQGSCAKVGDPCGGRAGKGTCGATCDKDGSDCPAGSSAVTTCKEATDDCCKVVDPKNGPDFTTCTTSPQTINIVDKYDWQDAQFYTTPDAPGTQFAATLVYDDGMCQATLKARGEWPTTDCTLTDIEGNPTDAKGNVLTDAKGNVLPMQACGTTTDCVDSNQKPLQLCSEPTDGSMPVCTDATCIGGFCGGPPLPNPAACCPNPDPDHAHPSGSQINPSFNVHCDPDILKCVLNGKASDGIPVLSSGGDVPDGCAALEPIK